MKRKANEKVFEKLKVFKAAVDGVFRPFLRIAKFDSLRCSPRVFPGAGIQALNISLTPIFLRFGSVFM